MSSGSLSLHEKREPIVNLLTNITLKSIWVKFFDSNVFNSYLSVPDWYPKYGNEKQNIRLFSEKLTECVILLLRNLLIYVSIIFRGYLFERKYFFKKSNSVCILKWFDLILWPRYNKVARIDSILTVPAQSMIKIYAKKCNSSMDLDHFNILDIG